MESRATGPQKFVVGLASVLALVVALIFSATYANLGISAPEVEGVVMPPGMIMTYDSGKWLIHCHIPHHTTNNNVEEQGGGGLTLIINVTL